MIKLDLKKIYRHLYAPSPKAPVIVDVPAFNYLMIDGQGDPNTAQEYQDALEALYAMAYTIKFAVKKADPSKDFAVMPLEGLWWTPNLSDFTMDDKDAWHWTALILQPDFITETDVSLTREQVRQKKNPVALPLIRFEQLIEGTCAQIMHIGPYAAEAPTIERLHNYIKSESYELQAKHHEIYLGDPRRTAPEKLKTVIRQPIKKK
ncbi:MAG: GyrI-like domain-containing protein [Candidatus Marinimicrobia bacterium]|nr:GyrI-like domain-containing protein [Candidatus Neomarinimicrobiota bacterium]